MGLPDHASSARSFPRVPAYAWSWLQRSRPVLAEAAQRLTGAPPAPGFVDELRVRFAEDPFVRDVVVGVVCDVAFGGRLPTRRPPAALWDRGLSWWGAAIAGLPPTEFDRQPAGEGSQPGLFDGAAQPMERRVVMDALRALLAAADGDQIPAAAVRQLLAQLDERLP
jgi:hypothetical protein